MWSEKKNICIYENAISEYGVVLLGHFALSQELGVFIHTKFTKIGEDKIMSSPCEAGMA
jgi:hypothetical protein